MSFLLSLGAYCGEIELLHSAPEPYGYPRPAPGQQNVPLRTSFYLELRSSDPKDPILTDSLSLTLEPTSGTSTSLLEPGRGFISPCRGEIFSRHNWRAQGETLSAYLDPGKALSPLTTYTLRVRARSAKGAALSEAKNSWSFFSQDSRTTHSLAFDLDTRSSPTLWQGGFFSGFCKPAFTTSQAYGRLEGYELMDKARRAAPRAWSLQRDFSLCGIEYGPSFFPFYHPNLVRERETRRITRLDTQTSGVRLTLEDFLGHEQYGIASGRPLGPDYHPGDQVLVVATGYSTTATVVAVDEPTSSILLTRFAAPAGGWKTQYSSPPPVKESPDAPGIFPPGGCHLVKLSPPGTPCYFWGRLDKEWDLGAGRFKRRMVVNFDQAPGDTSIDGLPANTAKDYAQLHEVVRAITSHIIEHYGEASLDFVWSALNEPDLGILFFHAGWQEVPRFYDYTVDAILRAFEDHGYDSSRVFVGGLELGILQLSAGQLEEFLRHCSPNSTPTAMLAYNAAYADARLDGKRSRRLEELCRASGGKGSPCDFISVHCYDRASVAAGKLARAKEIALRVDPRYYEKLWINSHESCPDWAPPSDPAASDSYMGNGYFSSWCADVARRQLSRAAGDPRFGSGETILTFWPWMGKNFSGINDCLHSIDIDTNGDGQKERTATVTLPVFHVLNFLAQTGPGYQVLGEKQVDGHVVSGFASQLKDKTLIVLYAHEEADPQSRSSAVFDIKLRARLKEAPNATLRVSEYRFDREHNTFFALAQRLAKRQTKLYSPEELAQVEEQARLRATAIKHSKPAADGRYLVDTQLAGNGVVVLVVE